MCYIVEGYTDVISMHQNGIENVVSASGNRSYFGTNQTHKSLGSKCSFAF